MFTINQNLIDDFADKINEKEKKSNKVTSLSSSSTNVEYPSAKAVYDALQNASENYDTFAELQTIINNAQSGDTIVLEKDYKNSGNEELIEINNKNLKIIGNGHIIDADNKSRIFEIYNVSAFYFVNVIFTNGMEEDANGGAIYCNDPITISDCSFVNCRGWLDGGAISGDDLIVKNCIFINCEARSGDDHGAGGAIFSYTANIYDSVFINNSAATDGGAIYLVNSSGTVENCFFKNNTAGKNGGGIGSYQSNYKVYNCIFENSSLYNVTNVDYLTSHQDISGKENISNKTSSWNATTNNARYPTEKLVKDSLDLKANSADLSTVATTGDYEDLLNLPEEICITDFYYDATSDELVLNTCTNNDISTITSKEDKSNKVTSWSATPTHSHYPSEKLVKDYIDDIIGDIIDYIEG